MTSDKTKDIQIRKSGLLLHPTSFPSPYGIGDLGCSAYEFMDFLEASNQKLWQVLPIGPTGYGDSPYQAFSSFAGQPLIISPEKLKDMGLLTESDLSDIPTFDPHKIEYGQAIIYKFSLLKLAYQNFSTKATPVIKSEFDQFIQTSGPWLLDYALFMAVKDAHNGVIWTSWDPEIAFPTPAIREIWAKKLASEVDYYAFIQYIFYKQWFELKSYANGKNIQIIGDIPIFVAFDSADVWANKELFHLDEKGLPTLVAGVPPDYFSEVGQLWGNPLYDWEKHQNEGYSWWINRIAATLKLVDFLRIDHFRGFEAYWAIPYGAKDAINGEWLKGPYKDLFFALENALGKDLPIIAEDLGVITPEVEALRDAFNFPGMKILQFAFEDLADNNFLPHRYVTNCICYSGTHDNDTTLGWYQKAKAENQNKVRLYMNTNGLEVSWDFIRTCFGSVANMAIVPLQDVLCLDSTARFNTPGTRENNWQWRYTPDMLAEHVSERLAAVTLLYGR